MAISVVMPALEMAQETGKLIAWRKKEGDRVTKGEPLLEVETDKAVMEIESPGDGILAGVKAEIGTEIPVGQTIAWIVGPGEQPPSEGVPLSSLRTRTTEPAPSPPAMARGPSPGQRQKISPKARRLAREHNLDIASRQGSGPDGAILEKDILALVEARPVGSGAAELERLGTVARLMAQRTTEGWTTIPHFFLVREVDASALLAAKQKLAAAIEQNCAVRLSITDLLLMLVARALRQHPRLNASWTNEGIRLHQAINIAIAMAVDDAVVAAVIHQAHSSGLAEIAVQRQELTTRARKGKLRPADIEGATFTISNLGMYQVDSFSAVITPPQAAILAVGRISDRVVPIHGLPGVRPMLTMTLSCDHRIVGGTGAALFLNDLAARIGEPEKWLG